MSQYKTLDEISDDDVAALRANGEFDEQWYVSQYPDVAKSEVDPARHYLWLGRCLGRETKPVNLERKLPTTPYRDQLLVKYNYEHANIKNSGRLVVFAAYSSSQRIPNSTIYYLKALRNASDTLIVIYDNDLIGGEETKLDGIADFLLIGRHHEYDFGSYKRGILFSIDHIGLDQYDSLLICNDSCYGPIMDFDKLFATMGSRDVDFWGLTYNTQFETHIQSFFVNFNKDVFKHPSFLTFFNKITRQKSVQDVIMLYEIKMTSHFSDAGFRWDTLINKNTPKFDCYTSINSNLTVFPVYTARNGMPLIKVKALTKPEVNFDGLNRTLSFMKSANPALYLSAIEHAHIVPNIAQVIPRFSIICPFFNRKNIFETAIDSIIEQVHDNNAELILIDDGSTDGGADFIRQRYPRELEQGVIILITMPRRSGVCAARNAGIAVAKNPWIGYLDSDNFVRPNYLEVFSDSIHSNPSSLAFVGYARGRPADFDRVDRERLKTGNFIDLGALVHHVSLCDRIGAFDRRLKRLNDWDFILRLSSATDPFVVRKTVMEYNTSQNIDRISNTESFGQARLQVRKYNELPFSVTTIIPTFNHGEKLRTAVESALMQKGDFQHNILIGDDCSDDGTSAVAEQMQKDHASVTHFRWSSRMGVSFNYQNLIWRVDPSVDFIAVLEGDDLWTDQYKIEKQMKFLIDNIDCAMVFSKIKVFNSVSNSSRFLDRQNRISSDRVVFQDFLEHSSHNLIGNFSACMFRAAELKALPDEAFSSRINEIAVAAYFDTKGPIGYLSEPMSIYYQHDRGVWTGASDIEQMQDGIEARRLALKFASPQNRAKLQEILDERSRELDKMLMKTGIDYVAP